MHHDTFNWYLLSGLEGGCPVARLSGGTQLIRSDQHGPHSTLNERLV